MEVLDVHGHEIGYRARGFRVCDNCHSAMSEGWYGDGEYACSDACMEALEWRINLYDEEGNFIDTVTLTAANINTTLEGDEDALDSVFWTEWEEYNEDDIDLDEDVLERLVTYVTLSPQARTPREYHKLEALHVLGAHDYKSEVECNYCRQLFDSSHDEAVAEAEEDDELDVIA